MKTIKRMTVLTGLTLLTSCLLVGCDNPPKRDTIDAKLDELDRRLDVADEALKKHGENLEKAKRLLEKTERMNKAAELLMMKKEDLSAIQKELATLEPGDPQRVVLLQRVERIRKEVDLVKQVD